MGAITLCSDARESRDSFMPDSLTKKGQTTEREHQPRRDFSSPSFSRRIGEHRPITGTTWRRLYCCAMLVHARQGARAHKHCIASTIMRKGIQCNLILISLWGIAQCAPLSTPRAAFRNETRAFCQNKTGSALWGNKGGRD